MQETKILDNNRVHYTEIIQAKKEGNTISDMMESYGLSREKIKKLLTGEIKEAKIGKRSPLYDEDENNA